MDDLIGVHFYCGGVTTLGRGSRFVLWVQGCHGGCPGCLAPQTHDPQDGTRMSVEALAELVLARQDVDGITISGGEPFMQAEALASWITRIHEARDIGVIVYTGYTYAQILRGEVPGAEKLLAVADMLIDGPYVADANDGGSLRGSANQSLVFLTERYRADAGLYGVPDGRQVELRVKDGEFFVVGVPPARLRNTLHELNGNPESRRGSAEEDEQ